MNTNAPKVGRRMLLAGAAILMTSVALVGPSVNINSGALVIV